MLWHVQVGKSMAAHNDIQCTMIVQLAGAKRWKVRPSTFHDNHLHPAHLRPCLSAPPSMTTTLLPVGQPSPAAAGLIG